MTIDHFNRFFLHSTSYKAYSVGRLAMPLFAFVFVYNLAQFSKISPEIYRKYIKRLVFFGLLAAPAYIAMMQKGIFPLNIMFTFLVLVSTLYYFEKGGVWFIWSFVWFLLGGYLVEFTWAGVLVGIGFWLYCKKPSFPSFVIGLLGYILLSQVNDNHWALMALPIISLAPYVEIKIPRVRYLFWVYYPLHLTIFYFLSQYYPT